jgi:hypothetical protein
VPGDATTYLKKGTKISYNDGAVDYNVVASTSYLPVAAITGITTDVTANTFGKTSHGLANGTAVYLTGLVNTTGISINTIYFVVGTASNTFQLATTIGGSAIDLTGSNESAVITANGATVVTTFSTSDYSIASATLTNRRYSYDVQPQAWPGWFNWSPTITGYSTNPTTTAYRWKCDGTMVTLAVREAVAGTSNATSKTYSLPCTALTLANTFWAGHAVSVDNGNIVTATQGAGTVPIATSIATASGVSTFTAYPSASSTVAWTSTGTARVVFGSLIYEI